MIQDISPHIFNNQYRPQPPAPGSAVLCYREKTVLVCKNGDGTIALPAYGDLQAAEADGSAPCTYLFAIDDQTFYLPGAVAPPDGYTWEPLFQILREKPRHLAFAAITGYQLFNWYESRKYCGRCGTPMHKDKKERALRCPACEQMEYPKIAPAVIIAVTNGNRLLLAQYPNFDRYALLAGFVEVGETLEETVKREVMEEAGLRVTNIRYYKSQPWSIADNVLAGFYCDVEGSDTICYDPEELAGAVWMEREDIPFKAFDGSLTSEMIGYFKTGATD